MRKLGARGLILGLVLVCITGLMAGCAGSSKFLTGKLKPESTAASAEVKEQSTVKENSTANIEGTNASQTKPAEQTTDKPSDKPADKTAGEAAASKDGAANTDVQLQTKQQSKPVKVKALYLTGWTVGSMDRVNHFIDVAKKTEINSYVIDIKDDDGYVGYESALPAVREIGAWKSKYDADKVLKAFHDNDVHIIGRLVAFKDPVLSGKKTELAVKRADGSVWRDNNKLSWLDPYNKDSWKYLVDIAKEAVNKGFDEIQFDYMRFPNDGDRKAMNFALANGKAKYEAINEFLAYARKEMLGVTLSADVFGIICESPADTENIGQYLEQVGMDIDYISPMVYPSHYAVGQAVNNVVFSKPDLDPYGVVFNSLLKAKNRISKVEGYKANVRAYLQDFTASWLGKGYYQSYGPEQVRQQIKAVNDAGFDQWILWDANNTYSEDALVKEN